MPVRKSIIFLKCDLFHLAGSRSSQTIGKKDQVGEVACCTGCGVRAYRIVAGVGAVCGVGVGAVFGVGIFLALVRACRIVAGVGVVCGVGIFLALVRACRIVAGVGAVCGDGVFLTLVYVASFVLVVYAEGPRFHADVVLAFKKK